MVNIKSNNLLINKEVNLYLNQIIKNKSFANGYIFFGPEGVGKKETALHFINEIFRQCSYNKFIKEKITNTNNPDFLIIKPTYSNESKKSKSSNSNLSKKNNSENIKIDQIRNIKKFLSKKSIESEKKIIFIIDAHLLNEAASNCLLKALKSLIMAYLFY